MNWDQIEGNLKQFKGVAKQKWAKLTDSDTGAILVEAVDRRGGTKSLRGAFNSWHDVEEAYRFWAEKMRYRLCQWRGGVNCVEPKA